jgi:hypothetical protein
VAGEIDKRHDLGRALTDLLPGELLTLGAVDGLVVRRGEYCLARGRKAEDLAADGRRAARLNLVRVTEERDSSFATAVIEASAGEHTKGGRFARVDIADNGDSNLHHLLDTVGTQPYKPAARVVLAVQLSDVGLDRLARCAQPGDRRVELIGSKRCGTLIAVGAEGNEHLAVAAQQ